MAIITPPAVRANPGWPFRPTKHLVREMAFYAPTPDASDVPLRTAQHSLCYVTEFNDEFGL
jgi:hypothetical protein